MRAMSRALNFNMFGFQCVRMCVFGVGVGTFCLTWLLLAAEGRRLPLLLKDSGSRGYQQSRPTQFSVRKTKLQLLNTVVE